VSGTAANDFWDEWETAVADDILHSIHAGDNHDNTDLQSPDEVVVALGVDNAVAVKRGGVEEMVGAANT